jgi:adenosylhomocysteine nucleosidase
MTYTLLVFAMKEERDAFLRVMPNHAKTLLISEDLHQVTIKNKHLLLLQTGVTMLTAFKLVKVFEKYSIDEVLNLGTCAGLRHLEIGDVIHTRCFYNDDLDLSMFGRTKGHLVKVNPAYHQHPVLVSGSTFLANQEDVKRVIETFDADAFDMESFGYYAVCEDYQIPFSAIRGVTDDGKQHANSSFEENLKVASEKASLKALTYLNLR